MTASLHPLLDRLLRRVGATADEPPSPSAWRSLLDLVARTYHDADQDRYTIERAMDVSSAEMQELYRELRRRAENEVNALRQANDRHRLLFDSNPLPMWVIDSDSLAFLDVNHAMTRTYGYSRDELLGMRAMDVKLPEDVPEMVASVASAPLAEIHHVGLRRHRHKDGSILEMDITVHALDIEGKRCVLGIAQDRTRARRIEEDLRQAQKMEAIGRLAGGVAHDFNNLLSVILANAEFALENVGDSHLAAADLCEIRDAALRAAGLTRQLLMFSRKQKRQPRPLALSAVVAGVDSMLSRLIGEDVAMSALIASDLGTIEADPGEVEQIVMNLVVNARDAMPGGGRLMLETANVFVDEAYGLQIGVLPGHYVTLAVTDTGCGMTAEVRSRIFEPFFTTKDVDKGTGLGLSTVFGIMQHAGGGVTVYSEPGIGSTFRVYWPRVDAVAAAQDEACSETIRGSGSVLVVEDDPQLRRIICKYLTAWGYATLEAPNGARATQMAGEHAGAIDVLLTDLVMPGLDGRSLSEEVLALSPKTSVVFMSGYTEHAALQRAALGPDDHFVQKPFTAQALSRILRRALDGRAVGIDAS